MHPYSALPKPTGNEEFATLCSIKILSLKWKRLDRKASEDVQVLSKMNTD